MGREQEGILAANLSFGNRAWDVMYECYGDIFQSTHPSRAVGAIRRTVWRQNGMFARRPWRARDSIFP